MSAWFGLLAPARTPDDISARITEATLAALQQPDVRDALVAIGGLVTPMGADAFKRFIADENGRGVRRVGPGSTRHQPNWQIATLIVRSVSATWDMPIRRQDLACRMRHSF